MVAINHLSVEVRDGMSPAPVRREIGADDHAGVIRIASDTDSPATSAENVRPEAVSRSTSCRRLASRKSASKAGRSVAKLRGARERKRAVAGKCEGRKGCAEINPERVSVAKR